MLQEPSHNYQDNSSLPKFLTKLIQSSLPDSKFRCKLKETASSIGKQAGLAGLSIETLPSITFRSISESFAVPHPLTAAWQMIRIAAKLLDDVEDGEVVEQKADVINKATGLIFLAQASLDYLSEFGIPQKTIQQIRIRFTQVCLQTCLGQDSDLNTRWNSDIIPAPDDWLEVARAKSGFLFAWASWAGAASAGADAGLQDHYWNYGLHLGILMQIADDFNGIWGKSSISDLSSFRVTLPICYALFVATSKERGSLLSLLKESQLGSANGLQECKTMITNLGTQKFTVAAAQIQRYEAMDAIRQMKLSDFNSNNLIVLVDALFPVLAKLSLNSNEHLTSKSKT